MAEGGSQHDRLRPLLGSSAFAQGIVRELDDRGYAVLPGVFTPEETAAEYDRMWRWVERVSPGVRRSSPSTWQMRRGADPWPCSQRDMMQLHQAGWVFSEARERMAERVFEPLYGTKELHCSKDGFLLQRPTAGDLELPPNDHFDQGSALSGLHCIQGSVALTDQEHEDGCFLCWPGSHRYHRDITTWRGPKRGRQDWIMLRDGDKEFLQQQGIEPLRVPVKRGDVILWRSDLVHKGAPPIGRRDNFRGVVYICMLPAKLTPEEVYPQKRQAFERLETGSHWPCKEEWFSPRRDPCFSVRPYFTSAPELTPRLRLLYGLERYVEQAPAAGLPATGGQAFVVQRVAKRSAAERGAVKWTSPVRPVADAIRIESNGVLGDYNHYRTTAKHSTLDRAVSVVTLEVLASLRRDGFDLHAGDLGENVTLEAPEAALAPGARLRAEGAEGAALELQIAEPMVPCANLERLPALAAMPERQRKAFPRACRGRRGWYARVLVGGELRVGSRLFLSPSPSAAAAASSDPAPAASGTAGSEEATAATSSGRVRRWRRVAPGAGGAASTVAAAQPGPMQQQVA